MCAAQICQDHADIKVFAEIISQTTPNSRKLWKFRPANIHVQGYTCTGLYMYRVIHVQGYTVCWTKMTCLHVHENFMYSSMCMLCTNFWDQDNPRIILRKVWIWVLCNNPRIVGSIHGLHLTKCTKYGWRAILRSPVSRYHGIVGATVHAGKVKQKCLDQKLIVTSLSLVPTSFLDMKVSLVHFSNASQCANYPTSVHKPMNIQCTRVHVYTIISAWASTSDCPRTKLGSTICTGNLRTVPIQTTCMRITYMYSIHTISRRTFPWKLTIKHNLHYVCNHHGSMWELHVMFCLKIGQRKKLTMPQHRPSPWGKQVCRQGSWAFSARKEWEKRPCLSYP